MVSWKPPLLEAQQLAKLNAEESTQLISDFEGLKRRAESVETTYSSTLQRHFDGEIAPFADIFSRIKNVELEELVLMDAVPEIRSIRPETRKVSLDAVQGLVSIAGGAAAGAGAGALTFAAVGSLAAASTGTAISTLSGAAATSATLAWLGGGSLASGGMGMAGGTMVLGGLVAVPVVLAAGGFLWWQGSKELAKQEQVAAELEGARAEFTQQAHVVSAVETVTRQSTRVLDGLGRHAAALNSELGATVSAKNDYRDFSAKERETLALHVALVLAMTSVMSSPILTSDGHVDPEFHARVGEASALLDAR